MDPREREEQIVQRAIEHFAAEGFDGSTRDLAQKIGVTQSLLYRYFPTKEALVETVYERVYVARWNPAWQDLLRDRSRPVDERLKTFYVDYAAAMLESRWVRILVFAGLKQTGINDRVLTLLGDRIHIPVVTELRLAYGLPRPRTRTDAELELELVRGLHASIFYLGMRRWVYGTPVPSDQKAVVELLVDSFILSFRANAASAART